MHQLPNRQTQNIFQKFTQLSQPPSAVKCLPPPLSDNPSDLVKYYNDTLFSCLEHLATIKLKQYHLHTLLLVIPLNYTKINPVSVSLKDSW